MGKKVIRIRLSEKDIDRAIKELEQYKLEIIRKTELLRKKIAERIGTLAQSGFNGAVVIAAGEDAVWVEFGAGVYHNGSAGSSPHPKGAELGFTIGGYGKGMGKRKTWGFYEDGELRLTHGAPAVMPMYNAMKTVCDEIASIAKEVFQ